MELLKTMMVTAGAYCLGSISGAYVVGRLVCGVDMTEVGNGRIGASFAIKRLGPRWGITAGAVDFSKGLAAVGASLLLRFPASMCVAAGIGVVAGHNWSIFLRFKGGRGAAASFGALLALIPTLFLLAVAMVSGPFVLTRRLDSILGIRRTTLFFGVLMAVITVLLWANIIFDTSARLPLDAQPSPAMLVLPTSMFVLNIIKRPWHPAIETLVAQLTSLRK